MKEILTFIAELFKVLFLLLWYLICEFFRLVKIPLIILIALTVGGILTGKLNGQEALVFFCLSFVGIIFTSLPVLAIGEQLIENIQIMLKGKKYIGTCTGYTSGNRTRSSSVHVEWTDDEQQIHDQSFSAVRFKFTYPHPITIYSLNNDQDMTNLGILTIIRILLYFLLFLVIWIFCTVGTIHWIDEIFRYVI